MVSLTKAGLGAAATVAASWLLQWLLLDGPYRHKPMGVAEEPHFVLCETEYGKPCTRTEPVRWIVDFYRPLATRAAEIVMSGRTPVVLHIGASNFDDDIPEYLSLMQAVRNQSHARLVLVEPEMEHRDVLLKVHASLGLKAEDVTVVSAAMDKECRERVVQYVFSDRLFRDFADPKLYASLRSSLRSWRSFDKDKLLSSVKFVATKKDFATGEGSAQQWDHFHRHIVPAVKRIYEAGNVSEYIEEEEIPCLSAADLVTKADLEPSDIVMSTIDAEGFDVPILSGFTSLEGFRPTLQRWEGRLHRPDDKKMVTWFKLSGYRIGINGYAHSGDILAYVGLPV